MERKYANTETKTVATMFVGKEVEKSAAYGMTTLFVVGLQEFDEVVTKANAAGATHIYLGANMSFRPENTYDYQEWEDLAVELLRVFDYVTLDFDHSYYLGILETRLIESNNFIPMMSIKLPYIEQLPYNTVVKVDDTGFNQTNPGVWCHSIHSLKSLESFTPWHKYNDDQAT